MLLLVGYADRLFTDRLEVWMFNISPANGNARQQASSAVGVMFSRYSPIG